MSRFHGGGAHLLFICESSVLDPVDIRYQLEAALKCADLNIVIIESDAQLPIQVLKQRKADATPPATVLVEEKLKISACGLFQRKKSSNAMVVLPVILPVFCGPGAARPT